MEIHAEIRRGVNSAELSLRQACSLYHLNFRTVGRLVASVEPVAYQQVEPRPKPVLGPFLDIIASILQARGSPRPCQTASHRSTHLRSPSPRARLHYTGCASIVRAAVADYKQSQAEVFVPLLHPPGEAEVDFGRAVVDVAGSRHKAALFVLTLPHSNARFAVGLPRECTETFHEGHVRAFHFFGGVPADTALSHPGGKWRELPAQGSATQEKGCDPTVRLSQHEQPKRSNPNAIVSLTRPV
jgi:hypothetical protein